MRRETNKQAGFTIIELMIATAVLSTILLLVTIVMISIGNLYYKGINQSRVQDDVRSIADDVSQNLQLSDGATTATNGTTHAYCIGANRYTFVYFQQISSTPAAGQSRHVLWRDANPTPGSCSLAAPYTVNLNLATPSAGGTELIAPNSRLTSFCISGSVTGSCNPDKSPYDIQVGVIYGDSDLICDSGYTTPADCAVKTGESAHMASIIAGAGATKPVGEILCKGGTDQQFCAKSLLETTVAQRLTGS